MKIESLTLSNYKRFQAEKTINFYLSEDGSNDVTVLVGNNGSGKTSILQAVALVLGASRGNSFQLDKLNWEGFNWTYLKLRLDPIIQAKLKFSIDELKAINELADILYPENNFKKVDAAKDIYLKLNYPKKRFLATTGGQRGFNKILGFQYALLAKSLRVENHFYYFDRLGSCYWYTERRTNTSIVKEGTLHLKTLNDLRSQLQAWYTFNQSIKDGTFIPRPGQVNHYEKLTVLYKKVFPNRNLVGPAPNPMDNLQFDFFLHDGQNQYEISEMSAGERAIFPILMDFAYLNINNSVILIDELELHLHPPLQQQLALTLPLLGNNNQFIITTHSDYVAQMFDKSQLIHLENL